jgi:hypothetical protein
VPVLRQTAPEVAGGGCLQSRSLVVDHHWFFISGPATVITLEDNRPIRRRSRLCLKRDRVLLPQPEMAEDAFYDLGFMNEADDLHFMAAPGTTERIDFPDSLDQLSPGFGRYLPTSVTNHPARTAKNPAGVMAMLHSWNQLVSKRRFRRCRTSAITPVMFIRTPIPTISRNDQKTESAGGRSSRGHGNTIRTQPQIERNCVLALG